MSKEYITINPAMGGVAITITASQGRVSIANAIRKDPRKRTFIMERKILSYSRDAKGNVVSRHTKDVANTLHASNFETTRQYVAEPQMLRMERTEEEKQRRKEEGDKGAKFSASKELHPRKDGIANTLTAATQKENFVVDGEGWRIRKLTPRECFRLMDVDDADIDKIQAAGIAKTQQYKLAGNSIVVSVLYHIFRKMFVETGNENAQQELF